MSQKNEEIEIFEEKPDHHYRTEIPNLIFEILSGDALIVYIHLKNICGDSGKCWMSMKNLSKKCGIGETTLRANLHNLSLDGGYHKKALIKITKRKKSDGSQDTNLISITPIWRDNGDHYRNKKIEKNDRGGGSPNEGGVVRQMRGGGSPREPKQRTSEQEPKEQQQSAAVSLFHFDILENIQIPLKDKAWLTKHYSEPEISEAIKWALNPLTILNKSLAAALKWACKEKPENPKNQQEEVKDNADYAFKVAEKCKNPNAKIEIYRNYVEATHNNGSLLFTINFNEKGFKDKFINSLRKRDFIVA